jgi:hypothetical protein
MRQIRRLLTVNGSVVSAVTVNGDLWERSKKGNGALSWSKDAGAFRRG